jgi:hypothetical protein
MQSSTPWLIIQFNYLILIDNKSKPPGRQRLRIWRGQRVKAADNQLRRQSKIKQPRMHRTIDCRPAAAAAQIQNAGSIMI